MILIGFKLSKESKIYVEDRLGHDKRMGLVQKN